MVGLPYQEKACWGQVTKFLSEDQNDESFPDQVN